MTLPPYAELLGITTETGEGAPVLAMPFGADVVGRPGFVHGGALAGLLSKPSLESQVRCDVCSGDAKALAVTCRHDEAIASVPDELLRGGVLERHNAKT